MVQPWGLRHSMRGLDSVCFFWTLTMKWRFLLIYFVLFQERGTAVKVGKVPYPFVYLYDQFPVSSRSFTTWSPASVPRPFSHSLASRHIYLCSLLWYWGTSAKSVHRGHFPFTCRPQYSIIFFFIIIPWRFCSYSSTPENSLSHSRASEKRHHRGSPFRGKC